jgi:D-alanine-D-alanine ligase
VPSAAFATSPALNRIGGTLPDVAARIRLVVLFGGQSAEHEVSCTTAASVLGAVDPERYDVVPVGITTDGRWVVAGDAMGALAAGAKALSPVGEEIDPLPALVPTGGTGSAERTVVFPLLHGPLGEDGTVQGMLELADVPFVGSGVLGSALAMDKAKTKEVCAAAGIPVGRWLTRRDGLVEDGFVDVVERELGWPVFVKPANMGSSVGVSKVKTADELLPAIDAAFAHDEWVIVEEAISGRELECAVLGLLTPRASVVGAELVIPADVPASVSDSLRALALQAFDVVRAEGLARVDFFYEEGGRGLLLNEVNTMPGFTPYSMYPQLWAATGLPYDELIDSLVSLAIERYDRRATRRRGLSAGS